MFYQFLKKKNRNKTPKNYGNALIDVKMNQNYDIKIFRRGGATSTPDCRVLRN